MSGSTVAMFTAVQWQELEHQALIYNYLMAGVPVPSDLVLPIRRSLHALSASLLNHSTSGYFSYNGKKFDPEPGRCRRTDGKKWRCAKDAHPDSKYCEQHMHRGRNRSRKPVESQSTSQSITTAMSVNSTGSGTTNARSSSQSLYSNPKSGSIDFGSNVSKFQVDSGVNVINNTDLRYSQGLTINVDGQSYRSGGNVRALGMETNVNSSWRLIPTSIPTNSLFKPQNGSYLQTESQQPNMIDCISMSKQRQPYCFSGNEIGEWAKTKEPWSDFDATTELSMSMDPYFNARIACSSNDA